MKRIEQWKDIPFLQGYQVSVMGEVRSLDRFVTQSKGDTIYTRLMKGRLLKQQTINSGYKAIKVCIKGAVKLLTVHRLVAITFYGLKQGYDINHKDGDKTNNNLDNLEWVTRSENIKHDYRVNKHKHNSKRVVCIETGQVFESMKKAGESIGLSSSSIYSAINGLNKTAGGLTWKRG